MDNQHVTSINTCWFRYCDKNHLQLILDGLQCVHSTFYGNKLVSMVECFFEYQLINDMFMYIMKLAQDLLVCLLVHD